MAADYKSMYYHLAGRTATAIDILEATTDVMRANVKAMEACIEALTELKDKLKFAQQATEEMFMVTADDDDLDDDVDRDEE